MYLEIIHGHSAPNVWAALRCNDSLCFTVHAEIKFFRQGQALQQLIVPSNAASLVLSFRSRCSRRLIVLILPKTMVTIHTYTPN
jgi:hypothetical protein